MTTSWKAIESYFADTKRYWTMHQIDSYDDVFINQVPKIIKQFNPIVLQPTSAESKQEKEQPEIRIHIGASLAEDGTIVHENKLSSAHSVIRKSDTHQPMYPNECRLRNMTYETSVFTSVVFEYTDNWKADTPVYKTKEVKQIFLGNIPIMLHSMQCILRDLNDNELYTVGECIFDKGGYFIIDGKEKTIVGQERQIENKLYTTFNANDEVQLTVRSRPVDTFHTARITSLFMKGKSIYSISLSVSSSEHCK